MKMNKIRIQHLKLTDIKIKDRYKKIGPYEITASNK